ncbi:cytochrome b561/ferric reductase transmembrane protein family [Actinidia rufa]|uniref:Cytochrome b561/ferric reductase transmembrane protein family n=1 Tax=Actinidia rufa TaxID=165716 RepID=A0A7J0H5S9_9ERIC|nr:cytochrome b561/ferric reductase transmembrane protein family [Actinidia rufa]
MPAPSGTFLAPMVAAGGGRYQGTVVVVACVGGCRRWNVVGGFVEKWVGVLRHELGLHGATSVVHGDWVHSHQWRRWLPGSRNLKKSVHLCLQGVALACGIFGIWTIWTKFQGQDGIVANFFSLHSWMGLFSISLFGAQPLQSVTTDRMNWPMRRGTDWMHLTFSWAEELALEALVLVLDVRLLDLDELDLELEGLRAGLGVTNTKIEWMKLENQWFRMKMRNIDLCSGGCVDAERKSKIKTVDSSYWCCSHFYLAKIDLCQLWLLDRAPTQGTRPSLLNDDSLISVLALALPGLWLMGFLSFWHRSETRSIRVRILPWHVFLGLYTYGLAVVTAETGLLEKLTFLQMNRNVLKHSTESMVVNGLGLGLALLSGIVILAAVSPKHQASHAVAKTIYSK